MRLKVGFCGSGAWGITLANLIAGNGHDLVLWSIEEEVLKSLEAGKGHPKFPDLEVSKNISYTRNLKEILDCDVIVECVTAKGFRPVCLALAEAGDLNCPFIITSKGIEQESHKLLVEVAYEIFGRTDVVGYLSGPTLAKEVMQCDLTGAIAASENDKVMDIIHSLFNNSYFSVYKNSDIKGVALGGAIKNVIAIATGLAEGLGLGYNTKALVITRGLEEMKALAKVKGADENTCYGLAGIGDLIVTGVSNLSRNFSFGMLLGQGLTASVAKAKIGMTVEGEYTVLSAYELGQKYDLDLPIVFSMYRILYEDADPKATFYSLFQQDVFICAK